MSTVVMNKKDEVIMKLVHYFITEENYNPIVVNGVKDEIWLENTEGIYKIINCIILKTAVSLTLIKHINDRIVYIQHNPNKIIVTAKLF